jgi:hypothetical protein
MTRRQNTKPLRWTIIYVNTDFLRQLVSLYHKMIYNKKKKYTIWKTASCLFVCPSVHLSGPTSTSFVRFPPNFVEFKIMMCELCSIKDFIVHWVLPLLCLFETIQYALCHRKFSYMINQKFMKLCTLQDPNMKMCTLVGYPGHILVH